MKILNLTTHNPYLNLAIEEYLFKNSDDDVFMLWQNEPTVVIGKNQNAFAEINFTYLKENNIHIARRITGGGAVYHDLGNVNFSFISVKGIAQSLDFKYFTAPIIDALCDMGITASLSGRNDITVEDKKISGNAQCTAEGRVLHHGTLLYDSDLTVLSKSLNPDIEKVESKAIKSVRARVTNIIDLLETKHKIEDFKEKLFAYAKMRFSASTIEQFTNDEIIKLYERNKSYDWIFSDKPLVSKYNIVKKKRFSFGTLEMHLYMNNGKIEDAKILGDFFEIRSVRELEKKLLGYDIYQSNGNHSLPNASEYIHGIKDEEFVDFLILQ